ETYRFDGKTDPQIVRDLLSLAGHADADNASVIQAVCRRYVDHLRTELEQPTRTTRLMVGIAELLAALEPHEAGRRALVGLLTGNVAPGAALKLRSAGLDAARFRVGAYGSDSARRADLPAVAAARATALTGARFAGSDVIIVGDTPDDVACGRPIGARSVAVATGSYDVAALRAAGAAYVFATLADTSAALDELEVKARVDDPAALRAALVRAGAVLEFRGDMLDRRFDRGDRLADRDEVLRLRVFRPAAGTPAYGVLGWKGPHSKQGPYRRRPEAETHVGDPDGAVTILERLGFAVSLRIDRRVEVYRLGETVLRLEWYPEMDVLVEVEGEPAGIERAIAAT